MKQNTIETIVVFRKYKEGDILALFPHETHHGYLCMSYQHVGQHGAADYSHCIETTKPAKPSEYKALKSELESIGYLLKVKVRK